MACSELLRLFYDSGLSWLTALESAIAVGGAMFVSLFLVRLFLELTFSHAEIKVNVQKLQVFIIYVLAMDGLFRIIANAIPTSMTFVKLLPLVSLLVIFKSMNFVGVKSESSLTFVSMCVLGLIIVPSILRSLLLLFI